MSDRTVENSDNGNRNPETEFRRQALDIIANDGEAIRLQLNKTEKAVARTTDSISSQTN